MPESKCVGSFVEVCLKCQDKVLIWGYQGSNSVNASKRKHKNQINHYNKQRLMANSTVCQSKRKPIVEPRRAKPKTYRQAPTHWLKFYEEAVIESEARTAVVQLKSEA